VTRSRTPSREPGPSGPAVVEVLVLAVVLAVIALRATITEAPPMRAAAFSVNRYDQAYSLVISCVLIGCTTLGLLVRGRSGRPAGPVWGLGLFLCAGLAGCLIASDKRLAVNQVVVSVAPMGLALLLAGILDQAWKRRLVLALIAALGVAGTFECLNQVVYGNRAIVEQYRSDPNSMLEPLGIERGTLQEFLFEHRLLTGGAPGFFTTRNSAGSFAVLALFACMALVVERAANPGRPSILYAATAGLIVIGLVLTKSKGAALGLFVTGAGLYGFVRWRAWIAAHRGLVRASALALVLVLAGALIRYSLGHGRLPGGHAAEVRWQYWTATVRMIADHPWLGVGPGNFATHYNRYKPAEALESVADPHNFVLSLLAQYGPLGLIGFLVALGWPLVRALSACRTVQEARPIPQPGWALGTCAAAVGLALFAARPWLSHVLEAGAGGELGLIVLSYGVPGLLVLVGMVLLSQGAQDPKTARSHPWALALVLACGIGSLLVANLIDFALFEPAIATCVWAMAGCLVASTQGQPPAPGAPGRRPWIAVLCTVAVFVACWFGLAAPVLDTALGIERARQAAAAGDFEQAHRLLDRATAADRLSPAAASLQGKVYLGQSLRGSQADQALLRRAVHCLITATKRNPADFRDYEPLGDAYDLIDVPDQAYKAYDQAAQRYPACDRLWLRMGRMAERLGRPDLAAGHYARAIEIENAFRRQFALSYPDWSRPVSRLGEQDYQFAQGRLKALAEGAPPTTDP